MTGSRNPYQKNESGISRRALRGLLLTLLLPPVGLVYLWRGGVFRLRGRILVTALACIEMTILLSTGLFGLIQWDRRPATQTPVPGNAAAVTAYPGDDTVNALSNIDEIIAQNMSTQNPSAQETLDPDATPTPVPMDEEEMLRRFEAPEVPIALDLHMGDASCRIWTCDLTHDYVKINGEYRT